MEITAKHIAEWARSKDAQAALPRYIRRLIHDAGSITQVAVPAGDSTSQPGWDGELTSEDGNAWVPKGKSFWEMSCEAQVTSKANDDYNKRTGDTSEQARMTSCLVILTGRRWPQKAKWLVDKKTASDWKEVRAYDADDLEQWLEQTPAVKLRFGDEIGLTGHGIEDVERHWNHWARQTDVTITPDAFFAGRENVRDRFLIELRKRLERQTSDPFTIRADSVEEASAFAAAALQSQPDLCSTALIVTTPIGWRFVDQNASLRVAVAARPEIAQKPTHRTGTVVITPYATGDTIRPIEGEAAIVLERPNIYEFEKALISIGFDEGDAKRLSPSTGRSWSVLRRRRALNPAIRRPAWLDTPQASSLSTLCLLGSWSAGKPADRSIVAELARRDYEHVEQDLQYLALLDDAPILQIGEAWKAKSPLELFDLFGERITRDELDRFFQIAKRVLVAPNPELELPEEQRYAAQIHGKIRPESGLLISAICDTLVKLSVRGSQIPTLASSNIEARVSRFVSDLLHQANDERWLSLAPLLPDLAEAAPEMFLTCIEVSLTKQGAPITRLFTETSGSGFMGRCWHSGILWALERLAWAPERLTRIALLLARLGHVEIKGNWANSPQGTLISLFRSWMPQTAANLAQRIATLDHLIGKEPDIAFNLLDRLVYLGPDTATPSARPNWRDDDAGAGRGVPHNERRDMLVAAADRLIACAKGDSRRIAKLMEKILIFDRPRASATLALAEDFTRQEAEDDDKEIIRAALRKRIHWQQNYGNLRGASLKSCLGRLKNLYERLTPTDPIVRHRWLFSEGHPALPDSAPDKDYSKQAQMVEAARIAALKELYEALSLDSIEQLAVGCSNRGEIGRCLAKLEVPDAPLFAWVVAKGDDFSGSGPMLDVIQGLLRALASDRLRRLMNAILNLAREAHWSAEKIASYLVLSSNDRETWNIAAGLGQEVENAYWNMCTPSFWLRDDEMDFVFAIRRLVAAGRPRSALHFCRLDLTKVDPLLLADMLEGLLAGEEANGQPLDSYHIGEALDRLETSGAVERRRLINIGFGLIPALGYEEEHRAVSLYAELMSDPKVFTELICLVYWPDNQESREPLPEKSKGAAEIAWQVLHACQRQPGSRNDGGIDPCEFVRFIDETRRLCKSADRLGACDSQLGQILAHASPDIDGVWPPAPVRDLLDRPELDSMRNSFSIGARNKRGVTMRAYDEGGRQERELAASYRAQAKGLQNSHVYVAAMLEQLAASYESDGLRQDLQAKLRREGY